MHIPDNEENEERLIMKRTVEWGLEMNTPCLLRGLLRRKGGRQTPLEGSYRGNKKDTSRVGKMERDTGERNDSSAKDRNNYLISIAYQ